MTWNQRVPRESLLIETRNTLGSILSIFLINQAAADNVLANTQPLNPANAPLPPPSKVTTTKPTPQQEDQTLDQLRQEMVEKASEFIEDRIDRLGWDEMQDLVAGILRAMGYKTSVSPPGPDRGFDIFASPDGLGLQDPRIFVEVKHRKGAMGSKEIRSFIGGRNGNDKCLYVSTGGFTKDARYEAERAVVPVRLLTLPDLRKLLMDHYDRVDEETRALVPLTRLYWPVD